jgi:quercetin dioxygenase-like cupin family protein
VKTKIVVKDAEAIWQPSRIPGVAYRMLREAAEKNAGTFLVKMEPGTSYPPHLHPGGEEVYVVAGSMRVGPERLSAGDYLFTPPGGYHDADTVEGCTFLVVLPSPVEFLPRPGSSKA